MKLITNQISMSCRTIVEHSENAFEGIDVNTFVFNKFVYVHTGYCYKTVNGNEKIRSIIGLPGNWSNLERVLMFGFFFRDITNITYSLIEKTRIPL